MSAPSAPASQACRVNRSASAVLFEPVPAMTGTLFRTASTVISITRSCSSWERVVDSPVVPQGAIPSVPAAICSSISFRNASSSTFPFLNGVTIATIAPPNITPPSLLNFINSGISSPRIRSSLCLPLPDDIPAVIPDQDLRHPGTRIVIGRHAETVGAGAHHGHEFPLFKGGKLSTLGQKIAGFADRADHIGGDLLPLPPDDRLDRDGRIRRDWGGPDRSSPHRR